MLPWEACDVPVLLATPIGIAPILFGHARRAPAPPRVAVSRYGSISRAATELHLAQPALSRQIRHLEHRLGVDLFERDSSGVRLTEAGRVFLPDARAALRPPIVPWTPGGAPPAGSSARCGSASSPTPSRSSAVSSTASRGRSRGSSSSRARPTSAT